MNIMKGSPYIWSFSNRVLQQGLSFANTIILAHFITPHDFGLVGMLAIFISVCSTIADTGMGGSLIKEKEISKIDCSTVFVYNLFCSIALYVALFFGAPYIAAFYNTEELVVICRVVCLPIVIYALTIVPRSICQKEMRFDRICIISVGATLVAMLVATIMAIMNYGVWALIMYYVIDAIVINLGFHIMNRYVPSFGFSIQSFKRLFSFGLFTALSSIVDTAYENILSVLFGRYLSPVDVGYYSQAKKIEEVPSKSITMTVNNVTFAQLSKLVDDDKDFVKKAKSVQSLLLIFSAPLMILISVFSEPFIRLCFGNKWLEAAPYLSILCFAGLWGIIENTNRTFIKSLGRSDVMFKLALLKRSIGFLIILCALFIDVKIVLWAYVLASFISAMINSIAFSRLTSYGFIRQIIDWIRLLAPLFLLYIVLSIMKDYLMTNWILICFSSAFTIFAYLVFIRLIGVKEVDLIISKIKVYVK